MKIILVLPQGQQRYWLDLCRKFLFPVPHEIVSGGDTRFRSVKNGLERVPEGALVAVHDGVRPLVSVSLIEKAFENAEEKGGAYPVIPVTDSLRKYTDTSVSVPVDRSQYCLVQTPQIFDSTLLKKAYKQDFRDSFTDDVSVVEASGICTPVMIEGERENIKITTSQDIVIIEAFLKCKT